MYQLGNYKIQKGARLSGNGKTFECEKLDQFDNCNISKGRQNPYSYYLIYLIYLTRNTSYFNMSKWPAKIEPFNLEIWRLQLDTLAYEIFKNTFKAECLIFPCISFQSHASGKARWIGECGLSCGPSLEESLVPALEKLRATSWTRQNSSETTNVHKT